MRQLWLFFVKHHLVLLFLVLISIGFSFLFSRSNYQRNKWLHQSLLVRAQLDKRKHAITNYFDLSYQNKKLVEENARLRAVIDDVHNIPLDDSNQVVIDTLGHAKYIFQNADVITNPMVGSYSHMTIDAGDKSGVFVSDGVLTSEGVVGKVVQTSSNYAIVMPLFNLNMRLNVQHARSGYNGNLIWDGTDLHYLQVQNIPRHANVEVGDTIRVNKFSKSFPINSLVGTVQNVGFDNTGNFYILRIKPFVDFRRLNHVYVTHRKDLEEILSLEEGIQ